MMLCMVLHRPYRTTGESPTGRSMENLGGCPSPMSGTHKMNVDFTVHFRPFPGFFMFEITEDQL